MANILLLDDDKYYLEIIERLLKKNNISDYKLCYDYKIFLNEVKKCKDFCIAVIDHDLKLGITGFEIMGLIQNINQLVKIIICSGQQNVETAIRYYEHGCFYYLYKDVYDFDNIFIEKIKEATEKIHLLNKQLKARKLINRYIKDL